MPGACRAHHMQIRFKGERGDKCAQGVTCKEALRGTVTAGESGSAACRQNYERGKGAVGPVSMPAAA